MATRGEGGGINEDAKRTAIKIFIRASSFMQGISSSSVTSCAHRHSVNRAMEKDPQEVEAFNNAAEPHCCPTDMSFRK